MSGGGEECLVSTYQWQRRVSGVYLPKEEEGVWCLPTQGGGGFLCGVYLPLEEEGVCMMSIYPWRRRVSGVYLPAEEEDFWRLPTLGGRRRLSGVYLTAEEEDVWCLPTLGGGRCLVSTYPRRRRVSGVYMDDTVFLTHHVQPGNAGQLLPCNHILENFVCLETVQTPNSRTKSRQNS